MLNFKNKEIMANIIKFENDEKFLNHVVDSIAEGKICTFIEAYDDHNEVYEEEGDYNNYFLSEDEALHPILITLIQVFGDNILIRTDYDTVEENGEEIPYKYLSVRLDDLN